MPTSPNRRRIEIDAEVYEMLDRQARWLHIPVAAAATMLLRESLARYELQRPRSALAATIVAEGIPSPTLAAVQQRCWGCGITADKAEILETVDDDGDPAYYCVPCARENEREAHYTPPQDR